HPAEPLANATFPASAPRPGGSGERPANCFHIRRHGGESPKVKEQTVGRSPRPTTLPRFATGLVAGPFASGVRASDPPHQMQNLPSNLNAQGVRCLSHLSLGVGYGRIRVDSRHLGVPRAFRGLEGTP